MKVRQPNDEQPRMDVSINIVTRRFGRGSGIWDATYKFWSSLYERQLGMINMIIMMVNPKGRHQNPPEKATEGC